MKGCRKMFFGLVFCLFISVNAHAEPAKVIPVGKAVGISVYTDGLLVIGSNEVNGKNIAKDCGIKVNDRITKVNGNNVDTTEDFSETINANPEGVTLSIERGNQIFDVNAVPALSEDNVYRIGLWVRDSTAGIGTVTYYDPLSKTFAALGHAINDVDTNNILPVKSGNILRCDILSIEKSRKSAPGSINASFGGEEIGIINLNTHFGIYGKMNYDEFENCSQALPVAAKEQIHAGEAYILSDVLGDENDKYTIEIKKITSDPDKGLVIEVTDSRLCENTGGIVQGMSGSPIIQDGMFIGAVTHVFVNNPQKGYGVLAQNMLDMTNKL